MATENTARGNTTRQANKERRRQRILEEARELIARQDWVNGYIDLTRYRQQVLIGMLMTYAADVTPEFHQRLCNRLEELMDD